MSPKKESVTQTQEITGYDKEELFVHAYIRHMGNGAAAAREVFHLEKSNSAYVQASKMLRKAKVKKMVHRHMEIQRKHYEEFLVWGPQCILVVAQQLVKRIEDPKTPFNDLMKAMEMLARLAGKELSEAVVIAQIKSGVLKPDELEPGE